MYSKIVTTILLIIATIVFARPFPKHDALSGDDLGRCSAKYRVRNNLYYSRESGPFKNACALHNAKSFRDTTYALTREARWYIREVLRETDTASDVHRVDSVLKTVQKRYWEDIPSLVISTAEVGAAYFPEMDKNAHLNLGLRAWLPLF